MELSVIVPSWGLTALLRSCLLQLEHALARTQLGKTCVVVVDNGSAIPYLADDLAPAQVRIVRLDLRHSFSAACNRGAREIAATRYLFLNNDVLLHPDALVEMLGIFRDHKVGICGTRLVLPDDTIQHCGVRFDAGERGPYHQDHGRRSAIVSRATTFPQAVTAAAMMIDHAVFNALDGFDETFPFGYEDVDLCLRARQLGIRIACGQRRDSLHLESTSDRRPDRHKASRKLFFERWRGRYTIDGDESG
ncbi:glycosyltransferase [Mesorhizobium opportunistum]|uniref:glycosyltransferase family 2 protein n=1 Tax=Mesorhizobium opportunistum TaxID=593909 RepID=UPI00333AAEDA